MKTHDVMLLGLALCLSSSAGLGQVNETNEVTVVTPASAAQGTTGQLVTFMLDTDFPPAPPAGVSPVSVTIGGIIGTSVTHATQYTVTALFDIPISAATGAKDATIMWITPGGGSVVFSKAAGFTVTAGADTPPTITSDPLARSVAPGAKVIFNVIASGSPPMSYQWQKGEVDLGAPTGESSYTIDSAALGDAGEYRCIVVNDFGGDTSEIAVLTVDPSLPAEPDNYAIVDTGQGGCSSDSASITAPAPGEAFAGQDAQYAGNRPQYTVGGDGLTVYDHITGLTWQRSPDTDGDGDIDASDKLTWTELQAYPATLNAASFGGYSDWRLPSIKELYSLIDFRGTDPAA